MALARTLLRTFHVSQGSSPVSSGNLSLLILPWRKLVHSDLKQAWREHCTPPRNALANQRHSLRRHRMSPSVSNPASLLYSKTCVMHRGSCCQALWRR
jgi:hypothetical protein